MHVALVNRWYPPTSYGGVAMHNSQFAEACVQLGHRVTVIAQSRSGNYEDEIINGVNVFRVPNPNFYRYRRIPLIGKHYHFLHSLIYSWSANRVLREINRRNPIDVVEYADINAEGTFWPGIGQLVVRCHTPTFTLAKYYKGEELPYNPFLSSWIEKRVIQRAALISTPSEDMAKEIQEECDLSGDKFVTIPNAVDTMKFSPSTQKVNSDRMTILHVGRMERGKGIDTLIAAIPDVCSRVSNVRFVFVGGDRPKKGFSSTRAYIEQTLLTYIAAGQVEIRGVVSDTDLIMSYHEAQICVVPSMIYESFSYTVAQAMACGIPVVASRIGGIPETLNNGECGVLIPMGDSKALSDALVTLLLDNSKRKQLGDNGRQRTVNLFSAETVSNQTVDAYTRIINKTIGRTISE